MVSEPHDGPLLPSSAIFPWKQRCASIEFTVCQLLYLDHDFHQLVFSFPIVYPPLLRFLTRVYLFTHALSDAWTNQPRWNHCRERKRMDRGNGEWINFGERDRQNTGEELVKRTVVHTWKNDLQYQLCNRFVRWCDAWHAAKSMDYRVDETWRADFACHRDINFFSHEKMTNTRLKVGYIHRCPVICIRLLLCWWK